MYRIGEFSKISNLSVKTLRYYDKIGLLKPAETDPFTGYRLYSSAQMGDAIKIQALKEFGFSLDEIKCFYQDTDSLLEQKEQMLKNQLQELKASLHKLESFRKIWNEEGIAMNPVVMTKSENCCEEREFMASMVCRTTEREQARRLLLRYLAENNYQIIGNLTENLLSEEESRLKLPVRELFDELPEPANDDICVPFVNDNRVIGKWELVDTCYHKEDFDPAHIIADKTDGDFHFLYFLPEGERYWCFGWTKGYVLSKFGVPTMKGLNPYEITELLGETYMFLWFKDKDCFFRGAKPTLMVFRQVDRHAYTKEEIRIRDNLVEGFLPDNEILGKWKVCDFVKTVESFQPDKYNAGFPKEYLFFKEAFFADGGICEVNYGGKILKTPEVNWTKGFLQETGNGLSQHYKRRIIAQTEYLFIEFKSGDYFFNHKKPWWYVFTRMADK